MRRCVIVGGASIGDYRTVGAMLRQDDYVIYCDCGLRHMDGLGAEPDLIVGDFDSIAPGILETLQQKHQTKIERHSSIKDETDTELAMRLAMSLGADYIEIYGATGTRMDHVLGNIQLLKMALDQWVHCHIIDENNRISMIRESATIRKDQQYGEYVSLIPFTSCVKGLTLRGMKYPLNRYTLTCGLARGVSNEIVDAVAEIELEEGILLVIESKDDARR